MVEAKKANFLQRALIEAGRYAALAGSLYAGTGCASSYTEFHRRLLGLDLVGAVKAPYEKADSQLEGTLNLAGIIAVDVGLALLIGIAAGGSGGDHHKAAPASPGPTPPDPF